MIKFPNDKPQSISPEWRYPSLAKPESDGGYCYMIQRRISCYFSLYFMKLGLTPSQATLLDFIFGCLAALSILFQYYLFAILFIFLFGIWSCVDGEIARLSDKCSLSGDFFDTMTDRVIEMSVVTALFWSIYSAESPFHQYLALAFIVYLGGVYLLAVSSEKYRSTGLGNYPKKKVEFLFSWISSGSDIRLLWLSMAIFTFWLTKDQSIITFQIGTLAVIFFINFTVRMFKVNDLFSAESRINIHSKINELDVLTGDLKIVEIVPKDLTHDSYYNR